MEDDLVARRPVPVSARFELAAGRIADAWLRTRSLRVSRDDFRIAMDFLEREGWKVQEIPGVRVRLAHRGVWEETTREQAVLVAFRRLAAPAEGPAAALAAVTGRRPAPPAPRPRVRVDFPRVSARERTAAGACLAESPA